MRLEWLQYHAHHTTTVSGLISLVPFLVAAYPLSLGFSPPSPSPPISSILFPPLPSWPPPPRRCLSMVRQGTARTHTWARKAERGTSRFGLAAGGRRACDGFSSLSVSVCVLQGCTLQRPPPPPQLALWRKRSLQRPPAAAAIFARPPAVPARVVPGWRRESRVQTDDEWGPPGEQGEGLREPSLLLYIPVRRQAVGLEPGPLLLQSFPLLCFSYLSLRLHPRFALAFPVAVVRHSMHVHSCLGRR